MRHKFALLLSRRPEKKHKTVRYQLGASGFAPHHTAVTSSSLTSTEKCFIHNHCEIASEQSEGKYLIWSYFHSDHHWINDCLFILSLSLTKLLLEPLLSVSNDDDERPFGLRALNIIRGLGQVSLLWLDDVNHFCLEHIFRPVDLNGRSLVLGFGQSQGSRLDRELRLAAYPEGAFRDADSTPGDGQGVFERGGRRVGAGVDAVALALHLHLHRKPLCVLTGAGGNMNATKKSRWNTTGVAGFLHLTWARIFRGPFPASLALTVNSAGWLTRQPVFSRPGP